MIENEDEKASNEAAEIGRRTQLVKPAHVQETTTTTTAAAAAATANGFSFGFCVRNRIGFEAFSVDCIDRCLRERSTGLAEIGERERERQRETRRVVLYFLYKVINANVKVAFVRVGWAMRQISYDLYIIIMPYFIDR